MIVQITSNRERRLWIFLGFTVFAIFSSIGWVKPLSDFLSVEFMGILFGTGVLFIAVSIATRVFSIKPGGREVWLGIGIIAVYVILAVRLFVPERTHLIEYSFLALLVYEVLNERVANGLIIRFPELIAIFIGGIIGLMDETIQLFVPSRVFDWRDVLFNLLASGIAVFGVFLSRQFRKRTVNKE